MPEEIREKIIRELGEELYRLSPDIHRFENGERLRKATLEDCILYLELITEKSCVEVDAKLFGFEEGSVYFTRSTTGD